jgi:hypothetical protein
MCDVNPATRPHDVLGPNDLVRFAGDGRRPPPRFIDWGCRCADGQRCIFEHVEGDWYRELSAEEVARLRRQRAAASPARPARPQVIPSRPAQQQPRRRGSRAPRSRAARASHSGGESDDGGNGDPAGSEQVKLRGAHPPFNPIPCLHRARAGRPR